MFHQCKLPITSYGIILFRINTKGRENGENGENGENVKKIEYLMIRRKDSFGFIDIIRGKYSITCLEQIQNSFDEMSMEEKVRIMEDDFDDLWKGMWGIDTMQMAYKNEQIQSSKKFDILKNGIFLGNKERSRITMQDFVENSNSCWKETEWEFPKGRKNGQERDLDCALREFEEETGIPSSSITIIENVMPFEENFMGSNHKIYKHKFFLAFSNTMIDETKYQRSEVSKIEWKTLEESLECIRPYHNEKKKMIENINYVLQNYIFF
jgi:8-oxo-dGTP pyrophosphatase MutT (NUDIX family)